MEVSSWENHLFQWAMASMALLNNQRVSRFITIYADASSPFQGGMAKLPRNSRVTTVGLDTIRTSHLGVSHSSFPKGYSGHSQ